MVAFFGRYTAFLAPVVIPFQRLFSLPIPISASLVIVRSSALPIRVFFTYMFALFETSGVRTSALKCFANLSPCFFVMLERQFPTLAKTGDLLFRHIVGLEVVVTFLRTKVPVALVDVTSISFEVVTTFRTFKF